MEFQNFEKKQKQIMTISGGSGGEIYTVFDDESESEVENLEILHPDPEIKEKQKKIENPYFPLFPLF